MAGACHTSVRRVISSPNHPDGRVTADQKMQLVGTIALSNPARFHPLTELHPLPIPFRFNRRVRRQRFVDLEPITRTATFGESVSAVEVNASFDEFIPVGGRKRPPGERLAIRALN